MIVSDDRPFSRDHVYASWELFVHKASEKTGKTLNLIAENESWIKEAGFVEVQTEKFKLPIGQWPKGERLKEVGRWN